MPVDRPGPATSVWQQAQTTRWYQDVRSGIPFADAQFDVVKSVLRAHGANVIRVLDLGSGDGIATATIADAFDVREATLVDFSPPMLDDARARAAGWDIDVMVVEGDLADPRWIDGVRGREPFDLVISRYAIHHVEDDRKRALYAEVFAVLRAGGWFVNIEHVASVNEQYTTAFDTLTVESIASVSPGLSLEEVAEEFRSRDDVDANILAPVDDQCAWLRAIGFKDVDCLFKVLELAVFAGRKP